MNLQSFAKFAPASFGLIVLFIAYFVWQAVLGVDIENPSSASLVRFGANVLPLSMAGEPWRLLVSGFLHIGLMHLVFNSFAMYFFGQVAERLLGSWRFLCVFLLCVLAGNLLSNYQTWQSVKSGGVLAIGAGASGGIMGLGACLLALSFLPQFAKILNKKSLAWVMAINLIMGFAIQGIDNWAHIGGAVLGAVLGLVVGSTPIYHSRYKSYLVYLLALASLVGLWFMLSNAIWL